MSQPTSTPVSVIADTIVRTVELGVTITNAALSGNTTVVFCDLLTDGPGRCPNCGAVGQYRDSVERRVTDVPVAGHPLQLRVRVPRYRCLHSGCEREGVTHKHHRIQSNSPVRVRFGEQCRSECAVWGNSEVWN